MNDDAPVLLSPQAATAVVMVRPHHFTVNTETANDNRFQRFPETGRDLKNRAHDEITRAGETLAELLDEINKGLEIVREDGTLDALNTRYFGD